MKSVLPALVLALSGCVMTSYERRSVSAPIPPVSREEAERLVAAGLSEKVIIEMVDSRGMIHLTSDEIVTLKKKGASDALLEKMIAAERREPQVVVIDPGFYYVDPYLVPWYGSSYWGYRTYRRW